MVSLTLNCQRYNFLDIFDDWERHYPKKFKDLENLKIWDEDLNLSQAKMINKVLPLKIIDCIRCYTNQLKFAYLGDVSSLRFPLPKEYRLKSTQLFLQEIRYTGSLEE